jgi:hypothetical protein
MHSTTLLPNFNKLKSYFPDITTETITHISYNKLSDGLIKVLDSYNLSDHHTQILFLILRKNEDIRMKYEALWRDYNDDKTSKEVAAFLLAYKESKPNQQYQLVAKPITGTVAIKDTNIARWMTEVIYNAIEKQQFPLGLFGSKLMKDLFGDNPFDVDEISIEHLKIASEQTIRRPTTKISRLYVEFCLYIQIYLVNETHLTIPEGVMLTDVHANFFFDILELLEYLERNDIDSEPKDYMHTLFRNQLR